MKLRASQPRVGDLLDNRRGSILDPAIERLHRERQQVEIREEVSHEHGRSFRMVAKAYPPGMRAETRPDGSLAPVLVVRFPERVEDAEEWSKRCRAWQRPPSPIESTDTQDTDPPSR